MAIKNVWIIVDHRAAFEGREIGSYKTERGAQRKYEELKRCFPFGNFEIKYESVATNDPR